LKLFERLINFYKRVIFKFSTILDSYDAKVVPSLLFYYFCIKENNKTTLIFVFDDIF